MYQNIAISGLPGAGSTTLLAHLKEILVPQGWRGFSGGEYMRQFATELPSKGHHTASAYSEDVDRFVDMQMRCQLQQDHHLIVESWLSGFLAQGIPGVLKVLVTCSNDLDRASRLAKRDSMKLDEAMLKSFQRLDANMERWSRLYTDEWEDWVVRRGILPRNVKIFFWNSHLYDLVIDTALYNEYQSVEQVMNALQIRELIAK